MNGINGMLNHWPSLLGGMLIGLSSLLLLVLNGRIAGVSGIAGRLLARPDRDTAWRAAHCLG